MHCRALGPLKTQHTNVSKIVYTSMITVSVDPLLVPVSYKSTYYIQLKGTCFTVIP